MAHNNRRDFLKKSAATALGVPFIKNLTPFAAKANSIDRQPIPKRRLGKTDFDVSIVSLGGQSTIEQPGRKEDAVAIINRALDLGINYIDTSEAYGDGISERYIGEVMKHRRDEVFLATKVRSTRKMHDVETYFERSCERLQTDFIDLYHLHFVSNMDTLNEVMDPEDGAIHALKRLKNQGRIGNIGISGHSTEVLTEALNRFDFDCIFLTLNPAGMAMNQSPMETREFLKTMRGKDVGVISMKVTGRNSLFNTGVSMPQALNYSLSAGRGGQSFPVATATIGITDIEQVDENVRLAKQLQNLTDTDMDELESTANG